MKKQNDYIYLEKNDETINLGDLEITIPIYVKKAFKRFRININNLTLERQCFKCYKWFQVANYQNEEFIPIDISKLRFIGDKSGFDCRCESCYDTKPLPPPEPPTDEDILNVAIAKDIKKYYKAMSFINDTTLKECITVALREYMDKNPIDSIKL